ARPTPPGHEPPRPGMRTANVRVRLADRRCADPDQDLIVLLHRLLDVLEVQDLGGSVAVLDDGLHGSEYGEGRRTWRSDNRWRLSGHPPQDPKTDTPAPQPPP